MVHKGQISAYLSKNQEKWWAKQTKPFNMAKTIRELLDIWIDFDTNEQISTWLNNQPSDFDLKSFLHNLMLEHIENQVQEGKDGADPEEFISKSY